MSLYFVYGSLRKGMYNHGLLSDSEFIEGAKLFGYKLVSLGSYPAIYFTGNKDDYVFGEVYKIVDEPTINCIELMEINAGYEEVSVKVNLLSNNEIRAKVWVMDEQKIKGYQIVESGDWSLFVRNRTDWS